MRSILADTSQLEAFRDAFCPRPRKARPFRRYRSIFLSDFHFGCKHNRAAELVEFLRRHDSDWLYLVGDLVDEWELERKWQFKLAELEALALIADKALKGTKVVYIPGNHDEFMLPFVEKRLGPIEIKRKAFHSTADGKRLLLMHGDEFDLVMQHAVWLAKIGSWAYTTLLALNMAVAVLRRLMGLPYWSLSHALKTRVKTAVSLLSNFKTLLVNEARRNKADGVVCGHSHRPDMRTVEGLIYLNCGDWVESASALVENKKGKMTILFHGRKRTISKPGKWRMGRTIHRRKKAGKTPEKPLVKTTTTG